jgi:uncharacterized protein (TIGR01777 family)
MKVIVTGSSGLVGGALVNRLLARGDDVTRYSIRLYVSPRWKPGEASDLPPGLWPELSTLTQLGVPPSAAIDAVVHLAGTNIAEKRWRPLQKNQIRASRVETTKSLAEELLKRERPPRAFLCASAVGYYGNRGDEVVTEQSSPGEGYLPDVCREWEAACEPLRKAGTRIVNLRIGVVLSPRGGALAKLLTPFKLGLGGRLGDGRQWIAWIALGDLVAAIVHCIDCDTIAGPVNLAAPEPVTNAEFTKILGRVLRRPTPFPAPAWVLRLALGEMADALLLSSTRMQPEILMKSNFQWQFPKLDPALRHLLSR